MSRLSERSRVRIDRRDDLLCVTLDDRKRANALSVSMIERLTALYVRNLGAEGVRAVLLSGAGSHFSAGADLEHLKSLQEASAEENRRDSERLRRLFAAVLEQDVLTIALVQGACVAGGCGLATAHDFVVAAEDARFMYSEVRIGFVPALVATFLPLRLKGRDIRELLLNPEFVPAEDALRMGLVDRVVPADALEATGLDLAGEILDRASSSSIALTKRVLRESLGRELKDRLLLASEINAEARLTADCRRGIRTFLETKSSPRWRAGDELQTEDE
jgi:methylglutaconyl-CoA hydratase